MIFIGYPYMRHIFFIAALLFYSNQIYCQEIRVKEKVIDSFTHEALPFTNVMVLNQTLSTSTDLGGIFELCLEESLLRDTLVISHVGYQPRRICVNDLGSGIIALQRQSMILNTFSVEYNDRTTKNITLNKFKKKDCFVPYSSGLTKNDSYWLPHRPKEPSIEAVFFPFNQNYLSPVRIKEVSLFVKSWALPSTFRLRFFSASEDQEPYEDLIHENIIITASRKEQLLKIDLEPYNLLFPEEGIFVGFELLIHSDNESLAETPDGETVVLQSPFLNYIETRESDYHYWLYTKGGWEKHSQLSLYSRDDKQKYLKPAISVTVAY